jgi:hypothetical protein
LAGQAEQDGAEVFADAGVEHGRAFGADGFQAGDGGAETREPGDGRELLGLEVVELAQAAGGEARIVPIQGQGLDQVVEAVAEGREGGGEGLG